MTIIALTAHHIGPQQYMRDNWLTNLVFASARHIADYCCDAWSKLVDQPS
jgi:hypothetical protein